MRLSEFADKRIINLYDGEIMGSAGDSDLLIDPADGRIVEIVLQPPARPSQQRRKAVNFHPMGGCQKSRTRNYRRRYR